MSRSSRKPQSPSGASSAARREKSIHTPPASRDMQPAGPRLVSLRDMVLTPARVPPFTIPPLSAGRRPGWRSGGGGSRRHTLPASAHSPRANRVLSRRCCPLSALALSGPEPGTTAAMSLPHLAKITTPYGFVSLAESPCVRRRESLFFQEPGPGQAVKSWSESSLRSSDPEARCCTPRHPEHHLPTSCDCSKSHKCSHLPSNSQRKGKLKYLLKKRLSA